MEEKERKKGGREALRGLIIKTQRHLYRIRELYKGFGLFAGTVSQLAHLS